MSKKEIARPNEEAMLRLLAKYVNCVEEVIFRLAWQAGLTRQEILDLKWDQIDWEGKMIHLPRRSIPMIDDLRRCLDSRRVLIADNKQACGSPYVIVTDGLHKHPTKVHLSRLVAAALEEEELLRDLRLDDFRNDFIIRVLEKNPTTYAMEIAGLNRVSINETFANYLPVRNPREKNPKNYEPIDEQRLQALIEAEESSEVAITLQLSWELGLSLPKIISLTWKQIDFEKKELQIEGNVYLLSDTLIRMLQKSFSSSIPSEDTNILLTPRSKQPFDKDRLSKVVRNALIRGGLEDIRLSRLSHISHKKTRIDKVYSFIKEHGFIDKRKAADLWGVSVIVAHNNLQEMVEQRLLVQKGKTKGVKYYLPEDDII